MKGEVLLKAKAHIPLGMVFPPRQEHASLWLALCTLRVSPLCFRFPRVRLRVVVTQH